jgi:chromosome segregation ATPase
MRAHCLRRAALALGLLAAVSVTDAQTTRSGGGNQNAQALQQMQQLASERTALQAENARLKQELEEARKKADSASAQEDALKRRAQNAEAASSRLAASTASNTESAARTRAQMDELVGKFRETAQTLKQVEAERNELQQAATLVERRYNTCRDHNAQLLTINEELLVRLENTGFWTKLAADEPFTRLKRTQLDNLASDYRARARELAEAPATAKSP